jgi:hypothetical protein
MTFFGPARCITVVLFLLTLAGSLAAQEFTPLTKPATDRRRSKKDPIGARVFPCEDTNISITASIGVARIGDKSATEIKSSIFYREFVFEQENNISTGHVRYVVRISEAIKRRVIGTFEEDHALPVDDLQSPQLQTKSLNFAHFLDLPAGKYVADIVIRDILDGCTGIKTIRFSVL